MNEGKTMACEQKMRDAGIYAMRNTRSGALYVGSSSNLPLRFRYHLSSVRRGFCDVRALCKHFPKKWIQCIQFEILERLDITEAEWADRDTRPAARRRLIDAEHRWIRQLNPNVNIAMVAPEVGYEIPVIDRTGETDAPLDTIKLPKTA